MSILGTSSGIIAHRSLEFWKAVELRQEVLRRPLGLSLSVEEVLQESDPQRHYGLFAIDSDADDESTILACASAIPLENGHAKIRQVAVRVSAQKQGWGREIMFTAEEDLRHSLGIHTISLHARAEVVGFYETLGYRIVGELFEEIGIPHRKMLKQLIK